MSVRYGEAFTQTRQPAPHGATTRIGDVDVRLMPAGHVLGSAQVEVKWKGLTMVGTGDYKRRADPTCPAFEVVPCNIFISEATFALPVFRHPDAAGEVAKLLASIRAFPDRAHLVGVCAFGKAQRVISDHADWNELTQTVCDVNPEELWITHGRDDALMRWAELAGRKARPLHLVGYEDEAGE